MTLQNPYNQYKQNQVLTASPGELTLMLFDGTIRFIKQTQQFIIERKFERAHQSNLRAQDIINEFMVTLNMNYEISSQLRDLYDYIKSRLIEANIKKDTEILDEVLGLVTDLRQTWAEAVKLARQQQSVGSLS